VLFNSISIILTILFVIVTMVLLVVAGFNPNHVVVVYYDAFSEYWLELGLFSIASVVIFFKCLYSIGKT
jgi:hypothetical protein